MARARASHLLLAALVALASCPASSASSIFAETCSFESDSCSVKPPRRELPREHSLLQFAHVAAESVLRPPPGREGRMIPCKGSCACWNRIADGQSCGERIMWLADEMRRLRDTASVNQEAAYSVLEEFPDICGCTRPNHYEKTNGLGGWGGWCTCPDGQRYNVGDRNDGCAEGSASLACIGGKPGKCNREYNASRDGMQVTCRIPPEVSVSGEVNVYEKAKNGVGGWGGWCTCPNGKRYQVGDMNDGCAKGPLSLACVGGAAGECHMQFNKSRDGMRAVCAGALNDYRKVGKGVGVWGGWCTCPDGQRYNVGDTNDGCAKGPSSLACIGGVPGECVREFNASRAGMQVKCAGPVPAMKRRTKSMTPTIDATQPKKSPHEWSLYEDAFKPAYKISNWNYSES